MGETFIKSILNKMYKGMMLSIIPIAIAAVSFFLKNNILGFIFLFLAMAYLLYSIIFQIRIRTEFNKFDEKEELYSQLEQDSACYYNDYKVIITQNYIVSYAQGLHIYKFSDLKTVSTCQDSSSAVQAKWIYLTDKNNGINKFAILGTDNSSQKFYEMINQIQKGIDNKEE